MKAILYTRYGSPEVLELKEIPKPAAKDDEVLIKVRATTVSSADWRARTLSVPKGFGLMARLVFGISKPRKPILGPELSVVIISVAEYVTKFEAGAEVVAS